MVRRWWQDLQVLLWHCRPRESARPTCYRPDPSPHRRPKLTRPTIPLLVPRYVFLAEGSTKETGGAVAT